MKNEEWLDLTLCSLSSQQILSLPLIDFDSIDEKLSTLRTESLNFLIEALGSK